MTVFHYDDLPNLDKLLFIIMNPLGYLYWIKYKKNMDYFNAYINGGTNGETDLGGLCHLIELIIQLVLVVLAVCFIVRLADG
jgi:hypothetical protein